MMSRVMRAYVQIGRRQAHYRTITDFPAGAERVLLLHQVSSSSRMFDKIMPMMADAGLTPVAPDLPGFGGSDPLRRVTISGFANWVAQFADRVGVQQPAWIIGHHTGAGVASELAAQMPERVAGLILVGVSYYATEAIRQKRWRDKKIRKIVPLPDGEHLIHEWNRLKDLSPEMDLALLHREAVDTFVSDRYDLAYRAVFQWTRAERLPLIRCPVTIVAGTKDVLFPGQEPASKVIPNCQLVIVQDGTTFMFDERTADLARIIVDRIVGRS